jgi:hypothetical protein
MPLDHFAKDDSRTFKLKYYIDSSTWNKTTGLAFISLGGEGMCNC